MTRIAARPKWRPTLSMVVFAVVATVLALPIAGLNFFRLYENELVRQTESELIAQSAVLAAVFAREVELQISSGISLGADRPASSQSGDGVRYEPILPAIVLARSQVRPPRPAPRLGEQWPDPSYLEIGNRLAPVARQTQKHTLAGFRLLDWKGNIITGRGDIGLSLAHVEEVASALRGRYTSVLRERLSDEPPPPIYSLSRGTGVRVFTAFPVVVEGKVAGIVYASRTPSNIVKYLYAERHNLILAATAVVLVAVIVGVVFLRTITGPLHELIRRTEDIGQGHRDALRPLRRHGTREIAQLSDSFFAMARNLFDRSDFVATFAAHVSHELKSPLTSISGAAELLRDSEKEMNTAERRRFLDNMVSDSRRMTLLLQRLRELAQADNPVPVGSTSLDGVIDELKRKFDRLNLVVTGEADRPVAMSQDNAMIVFSHLLDNAERHDATTANLALERQGDQFRVLLSDDGAGISSKNRERVFDTFFTTRRDSGGTGLGLNIVRSMLLAHGGSITLLPGEGEATFEIRIPLA